MICLAAVDMAQDRRRIYCAVSISSPHASFCSHHLFMTCIALLPSDQLTTVSFFCLIALYFKVLH